MVQVEMIVSGKPQEVARLVAKEISKNWERVFWAYSENPYGLLVAAGVVDEHAENPYEAFSFLSEIVTWSRRYDFSTFGSREKYPTPDSFDRAVETGEVAVFKPLYIFDHGGWSVSTTGFHSGDPQGWDWGQIGFVYVSRERLTAEYGEQEGAKELALEVLEGEIRMLDEYVRGEVYGIVYAFAQKVKEEGYSLDPGSIDSVWGFYGKETAIEYMCKCLFGKEVEVQEG